MSVAKQDVIDAFRRHGQLTLDAMYTAACRDTLTFHSDKFAIESIWRELTLNRTIRRVGQSTPLFELNK